MLQQLVAILWSRKSVIRIGLTYCFFLMSAADFNRFQKIVFFLLGPAVRAVCSARNVEDLRVKPRHPLVIVHWELKGLVARFLAKYGRMNKPEVLAPLFSDVFSTDL